MILCGPFCHFGRFFFFGRDNVFNILLTVGSGAEDATGLKVPHRELITYLRERLEGIEMGHVYLNVILFGSFFG